MNEEQNGANTTEETTIVNPIDREIRTVFYQNVNNPSDKLTEEDLADAWKKKLNPSDYKEVVQITTVRKMLTDELFGSEDYEVTAEDVYIAKLRYDNIRRIAATPKTVNEEFQREKAAAMAKIQNVKNGLNKSVTLEQATEELRQVYARHDEVYIPRSYRPSEAA